ncbi:MAG: hypothetical protein J7K68_03035 [Candidatus Diapherotrites archaeon]|nr:hypothetical protein [Candidatus Diapherotrites archaeon]
MKGQINMMDASLSFIIMVIIIISSLIYMSTTLSSINQHLASVEKQRYLIFQSDRLINDPNMLAMYEGNGMKPHTIDIDKVKNLPEQICVSITTLRGRTLIEKTCDDKDIYIKRLVFVHNKGKIEEGILYVWT